MPGPPFSLIDRLVAYETTGAVPHTPTRPPEDGRHTGAALTGSRVPAHGKTQTQAPPLWSEPSLFFATIATTCYNLFVLIVFQDVTDFAVQRIA